MKVGFIFEKLRVPDVILIKPATFQDHRGTLLESYRKTEFFSKGIREEFVQDNYVASKANTLRGLHYQLTPYAQAKLITVLRGAIYDVAVDLRKNSPTFGEWVSATLSEENFQSIYIPEGFAHGFCVIGNDALIMYKMSSEYSTTHERGIIWNDPTIDITWPIEAPIISEKDKIHPTLAKANINLFY